MIRSHKSNLPKTLYKTNIMISQFYYFVVQEQKKMRIILLIGFIVGTISAENDNFNFERIIKHVNSVGASWQAGYNFGSNITLSSIKRLLGLKSSAHKLQTRKPHEISNEEIPEEFDARKQWPNCPTIRRINDQGNCGSCWAIATSSVFSDRLCIASKGKFKLPLSAQEVLACCSDCGYGCGGGYDEKAWNFYMNTGLVTGGEWRSEVGCQPYELEACEHRTNGTLRSCSDLPDEETPQCKHHCYNPSYRISFKQDHHKAIDAYAIDDIVEMQKDIMRHGPIGAGMTIYEDFITYKSGIYHYTGDSKELGGHAVRIIGWGTENDEAYWLVANSWNEHWGDQGLFKIRRGVDECGIEKEVTAGIPSLTNI